MKNQKVFVRILCIVLALLMVMSLIMVAIPARAVSENDIKAIEERRAQLEQQMVEQAQVIQTLSDNQALIIDRKAALDRQIALNRENIELLEEQIRAYDELIAEKERELALAQTAEEDQSRLLRGRIRAMEENGNYSYLTFVFDASSFTDFLSRLGDIDDVMHYDKQLETDYRQARANTERIKAEYEQTQVEQSAVRAELALKKEQLDAQVEAACALIGSLDLESEEAQRELEAIAAAEQEAYEEEQAAIARYAAERQAAQLAAQQAAWAQAQANQQAALNAALANGSLSSVDYAANVGSSSGFIWPTTSTAITSRFGYRAQPTAGASTYHQAIDIGAAGGSPIYAVADGQVAIATSNNGLGNYVTIAHDGDTATRYSHMSNYIVQPGEYVTQGQIIGYVGATGIATGNHLDFAVIQDGQQVDPLQFYDTTGLSFSPTA